MPNAIAERPFQIDLQALAPQAAAPPRAEAFFVDPARGLLVPRADTPSRFVRQLRGALCWFEWVRRRAEANGTLPITDPSRILAGLRASLGPRANSPAFDSCIAARLSARASLVADARSGYLAFQAALQDGRDRGELHDRLAAASPVPGATPEDRDAIRTGMLERLGVQAAHELTPEQAKGLYRDAVAARCRQRNEVLLADDASLLSRLPATVAPALVARLKDRVRAQPSFSVRILDEAGLATCVQVALMNHRIGVIRERIAVDDDTAHQIALRAWVPGVPPPPEPDDLHDREVAAWNAFASEASSAEVFHASVCDRALAQLGEARLVDDEELQAVVRILRPTFEAREAALLDSLRTQPAITPRQRIEALRHHREVTVGQDIQTFLEVRPEIQGAPGLTPAQRSEVLVHDAQRLMGRPAAQAYWEAVAAATALARELRSVGAIVDRKQAGLPEALRLLQALQPATDSLLRALEHAGATQPRDRDRLFDEIAAIALTGLAHADAGVRAWQANTIHQALASEATRPLWAALKSPKLVAHPRSLAMRSLLGAMAQAAVLEKNRAQANGPAPSGLPAVRAMGDRIPAVPEISQLPAPLADAVRKAFGMKQSTTSKLAQSTRSLLAAARPLKTEAGAGPAVSAR